MKVLVISDIHGSGYYAEKIKEINDKMPPYKAIRGILISEDPLIKTTTGKIKRQEELKTIK